MLLQERVKHRRCYKASASIFLKWAAFIPVAAQGKRDWRAACRKARVLIASQETRGLTAHGSTKTSYLVSA